MYNKTKNRGLAFVTMSSPEEALAALNNLESYVSILFNKFKHIYAICKYICLYSLVFIWLSSFLLSFFSTREFIHSSIS